MFQRLGKYKEWNIEILRKAKGKNLIFTFKERKQIKKILRKTSFSNLSGNTQNIE